MSKRRFQYALVEFRPVPARPEAGRTILGILLEFTTTEFWVVGLAARANLPSELIESLDPLSHEMMENRMKLMEDEIGRVLERAVKPGDVLRLLTEDNPWSLHVTKPATIEIDEADKSEVGSVENIAQHYLFSIYQKALAVRKRQPRTGRRSDARQVTARSRPVLPEDVIPAWMIPPRIWIEPRVKYR